MASTLTITKQISPNNTWEVTAVVNPGGTLPLDIFIYENLGTATLGDYQGICDLEQYQRYQTFNSTAIPVFGNRFVKASTAKINVEDDVQATQVISVITTDAKSLSLAIANYVPTTTIIDIP
jgi:hypothetical protein